MSVRIMTKINRSEEIKERNDNIQAYENSVILEQLIILNPTLILNIYNPIRSMVVCTRSVTQNKKNTKVRHQLN